MIKLCFSRRITAEQALAHEYLAQYADPDDEPVSAPYDQSFEDMELPVDKWKGNFYSLNKLYSNRSKSSYVNKTLGLRLIF